MKAIRQISRDILLAGLGTVDEQNEEVKELLHRGGLILGMQEVDNEELCYNGNRDRIEAARAEKRTDRDSIPIGPGMQVNVERTHDEHGKTVERSVEVVKNASSVIADATASVATGAGEIAGTVAGAILPGISHLSGRIFSSDSARSGSEHLSDHSSGQKSENGSKEDEKK